MKILLTALGLAALVHSSVALAATGDQRLAGACVLHGDTPDTIANTVVFDLDVVTNRTLFQFVGAVPGGFLLVEAEFASGGLKGPTATIERHLYNPWEDGPKKTLSTVQTQLEDGETVKLYDEADGHRLFCEATVVAAATTHFELFNGDQGLGIATPRMTVGLNVPGNVDCGIKMSFPDREGLISELSAKLEITSLLGAVEIENGEYAGELIVRTDATGWFDRLYLESRDHDTSLHDLIVGTLYPEDGVNRGVLTRLPCDHN